MFARVKPWARAALVALALLLSTIGFATFLQWSTGRPDATAYWRAALDLRAGRPLYAPAASLDKAFLYPPAFAALFAPLTWLPPVWGYARWMASHFALLAGAVACIESLYGISAEARERHRLLLGLLLLAPVVGELREGQVNLLVLAAVAGGALAIERGRPRLGGAAFALAAHVKLMPAVLLLVLIAQRRRAAALAMLAAGALLGLLPLLAAGSFARGVSDYRDFLSVVAGPALGAGRIAGEEQFFVLNGSFAAVLHRWFSDSLFTPFPAFAHFHGPLIAQFPRGVLRAVAAAAALAMLAAALKRAGSLHLQGGLARSAGLVLVATQLGSPTFWEHHLVVLALLLAPFVRDGGRGLLTATAPFIVTLALPYALSLGSLLAGNDPAGAWLTASRTWGGPTLAVCWLWLFAYRHAEARDQDAAPR